VVLLGFAESVDPEVGRPTKEYCIYKFVSGGFSSLTDNSSIECLNLMLCILMFGWSKISNSEDLDRVLCRFGLHVIFGS